MPVTLIHLSQKIQQLDSFIDYRLLIVKGYFDFIINTKSIQFYE